MPSNKIESQKSVEIEFEKIRKIEGEECIRKEFPVYLSDESKMSGGTANYLFFPKDEAEIVSIVKTLYQERIPITISAMRTGIVGSAVPMMPKGAILSLEKQSQIIGIGYDSPDNRYWVRLQPGVTLNELNDRIMHRKLDKLHSIDPHDSIEKYKAEKQQFFYPVDPTEMNCSIGGCVAANASGARTYKYGATREWIRRLRIVLYTGEILDIRRGQYQASNGQFIVKIADKEQVLSIPTYHMPKAKNAAGVYAKPNMDLVDLFIGSEGVFGVISEVDVWITVREPVISNVLFFKTDDDAIGFVNRLNNSDLKPEFIEYFSEEGLMILRNKQNHDPRAIDMPMIPIEAKTAIFFDLPFAEATLEQTFSQISQFATEYHTSLDFSWSGYEARDIARFKHFRHSLPETVNEIIAARKRKYLTLHKLGTDMSVEPQHLLPMMHFYRQLLNEHKLEFAIWGHIGNAHVHVNILPRNLDELKLAKQQIYMEFAKKAIEFGGSVSAEHGIGKIKHDYLKIMYGETGINQMRQIKKILDPEFLFNTNNIFDK